MPSLRRPLLAAALLLGCNSTPPPGAPTGAQIASGPSTAAPEVVVCPAGSQYDPAQNVCIATAVLLPDPEPPKDDPAALDNNKSTAPVSVTCDFNNGWVALLPATSYPRDDQFLMQALIGFTEDPSFWNTLPEYRRLKGHAAKKCAKQPVEFQVPAGSYFVLAGEANTFSARGEYTKNGFKKKVNVDPASPLRVKLAAADLTHTWLCISCPFVAFFDPEMEGTSGGGYLPAFVVLRDRRSPDLRGTDRVPVASVPVKNGKIRLRVMEIERETTYLDRLAIEIDGKVILPSPGARSALAAEGDTEVRIEQGHYIDVTYDVPAIADGPADAVVIATGHYIPL